MAVPNYQIAAIAREYLDRWPSEELGLTPLLNALQKDFPLHDRKQFVAGGHVTCGAAVLNAAGEVLFILNRRLGRWLLPGGHLEEGDMSLHAVAVRELAEETGIAEDSVISNLNQLRPIDIGIYEIPANMTKNEPPHWHADFCFGFLVDRPEFQLQASEIGGCKWLRSYEHLVPRLAMKIEVITQSS